MKTMGTDWVSTQLTKREYFAAMAMQGILAGTQFILPKGISSDAVSVADALIEELNKEKK